MNMGDVISRGALPEVFSWLLFCPRGYGLKVVIVVTSITDVQVNLPELFDLGSQKGKQLQWLGHVP